nr:MAG TPA: hypothetical protein [Caudoviricetes sp.]DAY64426.1 MAG TPA: hypothetical protein [Caudoviricetes sp.]
MFVLIFQTCLHCLQIIFKKCRHFFAYNII